MKTVKNSKYLWCKSRKNYNDNLKNLTIDISDDEYQELSIYGLDYINENHIITYEAPEKLLIVNKSSFNNPGVHALSFNTEIIGHTFENGIGKLIFENELTEIKNNAFRYCGSIIKIYLSNSINIIGNYSFDNCRNLEYIKLPYNLTSIGSHCFGSNFNLVELDFFNINEFKQYALAGTSLNKITLHQLNPPILNGSQIQGGDLLGIPFFDDYGPWTKIYVPLESLDLYMNDENWQKYGNLIQPMQI
jgi:hypothetical protein